MSPATQNNVNDGYYIPINGNKTGGPKHIHVAHRKTQSELTELMIEQFSLQNQLEDVQQGQQPGKNQPTHHNSYKGSPKIFGNNSNMNNNNGKNHYNNHSRNNSTYHNNNNGGNNTPPSINVQDSDGKNHLSFSHKKTGSQSSVYGHNRRHSLVINEAKKYAAEEQAKRNNYDDSPTSLANKNNHFDQPPSYKFPLSPHRQISQNKNNNGNTNNNNSFTFPPPIKVNTKNLAPEKDEDDFIKTPTHSHRRSKSRNNFNSYYNNNNNSNNNNNNQTPISPFRHGSSASKDHSFNSFTALEPPALFQPGHNKNYSSSGSVNSFGSHNNSNNSGNQRKALFAPYLPQSNIPELVEQGRLVIGVLRVNKKNRSDAWVATDGVLDSDIYICGSKDRNRALEGDLVAVELLAVDDVWESKREKQEKKRRKDASIQQDIIPLDSTDDYHNDASMNVSSKPHIMNDDHPLLSPVTPNMNRNDYDRNSVNSDSEGLSPSKSSIKRRGSLKQRPTQKKNDDVEVEGQSLLLVEEEEINDDFRPLYAGHVVAVLDRIPGQLFSGTLGLLRPSQQSQSDNKPPHVPKIVWFKPTDKKVPLIAIPRELAPKNFVENAEKYADTLFVAALKRWPITSLHPFGVIINELGSLSDPNIEIESILRDKNFLSNEYIDTKDPTKERANLKPSPIENSKYENRKDFTNENVIAVSNLGEISDLSFHINESNDGKIIFGCHIVDATESIEAGSSLDRRARKRSTAVFLPQKMVNLLPMAYNEFLTLKENKLSLTISVLFTIDLKTFETESVWIGESFIKPSMVVSSESLNDIIIQGSSKTIDKLQKIATKFYSERVNYSDASLDVSLPLLNSLDDEKVLVDLNILDKRISLSVIEEIQHRVNKVVAEKLYEKLGAKAFLRRQARPNDIKMDFFKKKVQKLGYEMDISSSPALLKSILSIENKDIRSGIEILLFKLMSRAKYFVAGKVEKNQCEHFVNNVSLYTHFTAPLRRYADHVVHRQLKSILNDKPFEEDIDSLKITGEYCNFKKDCAYDAQVQAIHLLLSSSINEMGNSTGQLLTMATVLQVYESSFDIYIPELGIEKRVHGDQLPLIKAEFDPSSRVLELYWQPRIDSATFVPADEQNSNSYRNSIKNKFRSKTEEIANLEFEKYSENGSLVGSEFKQKLEDMNLKAPNIRFPEYNSKLGALQSFIAPTVTTRQNDHYIQQISELQQIPVLLRAEIGMALPCLTVSALNPFIKTED